MGVDQDLANARSVPWLAVVILQLGSVWMSREWPFL